MVLTVAQPRGHSEYACSCIFVSTQISSRAVSPSAELADHEPGPKASAGVSVSWGQPKKGIRDRGRGGRTPQARAPAAGTVGEELAADANQPHNESCNQGTRHDYLKCTLHLLSSVFNAAGCQTTKRGLARTRDLAFAEQ